MDKFKEVQEYQTKILGLIVELDIPGFEKAAETIERFQHGLTNYQAFLQGALEAD